MLPPIDPSQLIPPDVQVALDEPFPVRDGNAPREDLSLLCRLVVHFRPRTIFEFGTFCGVTTYYLARYAPDDAIVYTLDLPPGASQTRLPLDDREGHFLRERQVGEAFRDKPEARKIVSLSGDSALFDFSRYAGLIDLVLVDASHAYANCLSDSLRALTLRSPRGVIAWHDYGASWPGVTRALDDLHRSNPCCASLRHVPATSLALLL